MEVSANAERERKLIVFLKKKKPFCDDQIDLFAVINVLVFKALFLDWKL